MFQKVSLAAVGQNRFGPFNERVSTPKPRINISQSRPRLYLVFSAAGPSLSSRMCYLSEMKRGRSGVERAREVLHVSVYTMSGPIRLR